MKRMKIIMVSAKNIFKSVLFLLCINACNTLDKSVTDKVMNLKYLSDVGGYLEYDFFCFSDSNDSLYYLISADSSSSRNYCICDSLTPNKYYKIQLTTVPKGLYLKSTIRGSYQTSTHLDNDNQITSDDTLVGTVYQSPNIIGKCYISR